jgi:hypothetical protein
VLWYFQGTALSLTPAVNSLIRSVLLQVSVLVAGPGKLALNRVFVILRLP